MAKIKVQDTEITVITQNEDDYISLTDMARSQMQEHIIFRWLSLKSTIEYIGEWEMLYNPNFLTSSMRHPKRPNSQIGAEATSVQGLASSFLPLFSRSRVVEDELL